MFHWEPHTKAIEVVWEDSLAVAADNCLEVPVYQHQQDHRHNQALFTLPDYLPPYLPPPPPPKDRMFASWGGTSWLASLRIVTNSPAILEALSVKNETANPFAPARPEKDKYNKGYRG